VTLPPRAEALLRRGAAWLAAQLWERFGVTHDPLVYKCRGCGLRLRREHDHMTIGHASRLCNTCLLSPEWREEYSRVVHPPN
jgi:hypothetical protein